MIFYIVKRRVDLQEVKDIEDMRENYTIFDVVKRKVKPTRNQGHWRHERKLYDIWYCEEESETYKKSMTLKTWEILL